MIFLTPYFSFCRPQPVRERGRSLGGARALVSKQGVGFKAKAVVRLSKAIPPPKEERGFLPSWTGAGGRIRTGGLPLTRRLLYR